MAFMMSPILSLAVGGLKGKEMTQAVGLANMIRQLGGAIGIACGWGAATLATKFAGLATSVSTSSILLAFGVSAAIGVIFGYYPARRASRLNPIEALRFE